MSTPTVVFLAPAGLCALSWAGAGLAIPRRALSGDALLDALTRVAAGSLVVSLVLFALGRAGLFDRGALVGLTAALALAGALGLLARRRRVALPRDRIVLALLVAAGIALVLDLVASTAPPTSADALKYHLALPKLWLQLGSVGDSFWRWESFNPSSIELLYAQGLALGGDSTAGAIHAVLTVACAAAVYGLGRELAAGNALAGAAAAFLFVLEGLVTWEATSAFVELGLTFYAVLAVWHAVRWSRSGATSSAGWTGALAGAAAGTKYLGLLAAAVLLGIFGVVALVRRRPAHLALAGGAALAAGGAWYLKNAVVTGNPVYPLYFGGKWLTPFADRAVSAFDTAYGVHGGVLRLPILPVDLLVHGGAFDRGEYVGTAIFAGAVLALFTCRTPQVLALLAGAVLYLIAWDVQSPQARFLLPALAVLAPAAGAGIAPLLCAGRARRAAILAVFAAVGAVWLASSAALTRQLLPVTVGAESRAAFVERLTGTYDAFVAARARTAGTVALAGYPLSYHFPGRAIQIGVPEFVPTLSRREYLARLRSHGVDDILVAEPPRRLPELAPVRGCLTRVAAFRARFVTSRSRGTSTPLELRLYSLARCRS